MTLLYMDGFEHQDAASRGWTVLSGPVSYPDASNTRFGYGRCVRLQSGNMAIKRAITPSAKVIVGFAVSTLASTLASPYLLALYGDTGATQHLTIARKATTNSLRLMRGNSTEIAVSPDNMFADGWHYVEVSATISDTVGRVIVKIDGVIAIDYTGDTKNGGTATVIDGIAFGSGSNQSVADIDDIYICDALGAVNNDFLGERRVVTLLPNEQGFTTAFQPFGSTNNWDNVNDLPVSAADYNSSSVVGARDMYGVENLPATVQEINAVQANAIGLKSDAGVASFKTVLTSGGSTRTGSPVGLATSLTSSGLVQELDPSTNAPWTGAGINGVNIGAEVV